MHSNRMSAPITAQVVRADPNILVLKVACNLRPNFHDVKMWIDATGQIRLSGFCPRRAAEAAARLDVPSCFVQYMDWVTLIGSLDSYSIDELPSGLARALTAIGQKRSRRSSGNTTKDPLAQPLHQREISRETLKQWLDKTLPPGYELAPGGLMLKTEPVPTRYVLVDNGASWANSGGPGNRHFEALLQKVLPRIRRAIQARF